MVKYINPPEKCDICSAPIKDEFVDGRTALGPWANMCPGCVPEYHVLKGKKMGTGIGQRYRKQADGSFTKVEG